MKRKGLVICALALGAAAMAGAAFGQGANQGLNIAIATGGTGGVYYPLGGGMANVLSKYVPGVQATARVTGGSVDNLKLIGSQQSEVALVMVDAALDALKGEDKFKGSPVFVKTFIEKRDELAIVHAEAKNITLENQSLKNSPIPWHPGAVKYFAEQGVKM